MDAKDPGIILPEHVQNGDHGQDPPPSYEEAMGQLQSTVTKNQPELPPLSYIDILPKCVAPGSIENKVPPKFMSFSDVVNDANLWLRYNPGVRVWKCETVQRKVEKGPVINLDCTLLHEPTYGFIVYVTGLRLWLTKARHTSSDVQQLGVRHVIPKTKEVTMPSFIGGGVMVGNVGRCVSLRQTMLSFEGFGKTLEDLNSDLKSNPLPGTVLSIETSKFKTSENFERSKMDPECTCWHENGATTSKRYLHMIRIFYVVGSPSNEQICMYDVMPEMTSAGSMNAPAKFQPFGEVLNKMQTWIGSQSGTRIINVDTRYAKVNEAFGKTEVDSDMTDEFDFSTNDTKYLQFIRVFYCPTGKSFYATPSITSRIFQPVRIGPKTFETMTETMRRIEAWLRITGLEIMNVETVSYLFNIDIHSGIDTEKSLVKVPQRSAKYWLTAIRLYFPTSYQEPSPLQLPPLKDWKQESKSCSIF